MINISIKDKKFKNLDFLKPKNHLHRDFWDEKVLLPEISERLMEIASNILKNLDVDLEIEDVVLTGSIAGYNWHKHSDIDLHVILDFDKLGEDFEFAKRLLDEIRINWNKTHNIFIKGHEVELYFQHKTEKNETNGLWSIFQNQWLQEPKITSTDFDLATTERKAEAIAKSIDHLQDLFTNGDYEQAYEYSKKIKNKISNMRKSGLADEGIYSPENLAFKMLRNSNYLEKLSDIKIVAYDKMMSLNEIYIKDYFKEQEDPEYLEFGDGGGVKSLIDDNTPAPWEKGNKDEL